MDAPEEALNVPAGQSVHAAAASEVALCCPYLPAAHKEPEQLVNPPDVEEESARPCEQGWKLRENGRCCMGERVRISDVMFGCMSSCAYTRMHTGVHDYAYISMHTSVHDYAHIFL